MENETFVSADGCAGCVGFSQAPETVADHWNNAGRVPGDRLTHDSTMVLNSSQQEENKVAHLSYFLQH